MVLKSVALAAIAASLCSLTALSAEFRDVSAFGTWTSYAMCPASSKIIALQMKVEDKQGDGDDTGVNGLRAICRDPEYPTVADVVISPGEQIFGNWKPWIFVNGAIAYRVRIESRQGEGDDTGLNSVMIRDENGTWREVPRGAPWGSWGSEFTCPANLVMRGFRLKIEARQGDGDDTAVNNVQFSCGENAVIGPLVMSH